MQIFPGIKAIGKALWLEKQKVLIVADFHLGYEEYLNSQGIFVPRSQFMETCSEIKTLLEKLRPKIIVIAGDLKHEFGEISAQEWKETLALLDLMKKYCKKIVLVRGNHDTILGPIAEKRDLSVKDLFCFDSICVIHGHKVSLNKVMFDKAAHDAKILIIGHIHPAISLKEESKVELYKCFLAGKLKNKQLIIMPSFLPFIEGMDIREKILDPLSHLDISNFDCFVIGKNKIYKFGKLKEIID